MDKGLFHWSLFAHTDKYFSHSVPLRTRGIIDPPTWDGHRGLVVGVFDCGPIGRRFECALCRSTLTFPSVVHDWVNKGLGMSSRACATGHIKDPVPHLLKRVGHCVPVVGFLLVSFIK